MAIWMPLFTWAYNTRAQAVVAQHGETSLQGKYGTPKLKLEMLEDQHLAKLVRLSQYSMWGFIATFIVERIFSYVQLST